MLASCMDLMIWCCWRSSGLVSRFNSVQTEQEAEEVLLEQAVGTVGSVP